MIIAVSDHGHTVMGWSYNHACSVMSPEDRAHKDNAPLYALPNVSGAVLGFCVNKLSADIVRWTVAESWKTTSYRTMADSVDDVFASQKKYGLKADDDWNNAFIVAREGDTILGVTATGHVYEEDDFLCFGLGEEKELTMGRLRHTQGMPALERVLDAFRFVYALEKVDEFPIAVIDTEHREVRLYDKGGNVC